MTKRRSLFEGARVALVEAGQPLLYLRCSLAEATTLADSQIDLRKVALGLPQSFNHDKRRKISDAFVKSTQEDKRDHDSQRQLPALTSEAIHGYPHPYQQQTLTEGQLTTDVMEPDGGNAAEAYRLRSVMGFNRKEINHQSFAFSFSPTSSHPTRSFDVFVGGMPYKWTENDIREFWSDCGSVLKIDCMTFRDTGRFKGIAKITYETEDGHLNALSCDGDTWDGCAFVVKPWKEKTTHLPSFKESTPKPSPSEQLGKRVEGFDVLFMCNLPITMTEDAIVDLLKDFDIEAVKLKRDPESDRSMGYAHIHFQQASQLEEAIQKLDNSIVQGRTIHLCYAIPPPNWKPKKTKTAAKRENNIEESEAYSIGDGRYLVRLSGLQPTTQQHEVQSMFSDTSLLDIQLIWSSKKGRGSGAAYLMMKDIEGLQSVLKKNDTFYRGRRLHVRPGDVSDYRRKTRRLKKRKRRQQKSNGETEMVPNSHEDDDPLMALL